METPSSPIAPANQEMTFRAAIHVSLLCFLFGANAIAVKVAFKSFGVFSSASIRFGVAAAVIALWACLTGRSFRLQRGQGRHLLVFSTLFAIQMSLFYTGLERTYVSRGTLLINLLPFVILILAHFFIPGDRVTRRKLAGLLLGFSGVVCVFIEDQGLMGRVRSGDVFVLLATVVWACNTVYLKRVISTFEPFHIVLYSMLLSLPVFFLEAFFFDAAAIKTISVEAILALLYQALVSASFGFIVWNSLLKKYGAVHLHSFIFIMPLVGVYLAGRVLGEPIGPNLLLALVLIVAGLLVVHLNPPQPFTLPPNRGNM
ncbi:MAG: DMT family transporter [Desulfosarcina sp.]|nr:DMT family transporter [Desulfobacterales bacterium]